MKTARKHERFIEDLGDDIRVTPGFGFYLRQSSSFFGAHAKPSEWACYLLSVHELEKHDKVARGGLTGPLLDSWTGNKISISSRFLWCPGRWRQREP